VVKEGYVDTDAGFGADMGFEKFCNIKCRESQLIPNCAVIVATIRALKMHGGGPKVVAGQKLAHIYTEENLELLEKGCVNLTQHIENARKFGLPVVVAVNCFSTDTPAEVELVRKAAIAAGAEDAVVANNWAEGGAGAVALGEAVIKACAKPSEFRFLYPREASLKEKIECIVREIYRGAGVEYSAAAEKQIELYTRQGFDKLPVCMAKTHLSFSHDPALKGAPTGFVVPVREVRASVGAGFVYPLLGKMSTMPGLSSRPGYYEIDINPETGQVLGLS
jgi:formyltetrahydrofolate synthetase